ncbi:hypothetical protein F66182_8424 [Fusarium sp. NRRL 66182]|nr:hypothetical protein F66182_8424 [Fusarium sp. NRRL 66182]
MSSRIILRPVVRIVALRPQIRLAATNPTHVHPDGNLGGPGANAARMPITAAAGVVAGGFYIMLPKRGKSPERTLESDMVAANSTEIGYIGQPSGRPGIASHYRELRDGKEVESMKELSGRKGGGSMGGFRAE